GRGTGVLRLTPDANDRNAFKAWTLLTSLEELKGHEERLGRSRPRGKVYSRDFRGPNWLDLRKAAAEYARRDPTLAVVRGGPVRVFDRPPPWQIGYRHSHRRPWGAHRRQLAQALSRAGSAHPDACQPPAVHAVSTELAGLHSQRQTRRLVRGLCGEHGIELLDGRRVRRRQLRRKREAMVRHSAPRRRDEAADAPAPRRDGDRGQRHSERPGYSKLARLRRQNSAR